MPSMPIPFGAFAFPYSAFNQAQAASQQQPMEGTKPPETPTESVGVIVENSDVAEKINV